MIPFAAAAPPCSPPASGGIGRPHAWPCGAAQPMRLTVMRRLLTPCCPMQAVGSAFHPGGLELILNSEVWDLRSFKLMRSVPCLDATSITFNAGAWGAGARRGPAVRCGGTPGAEPI